MFDYAFLILLLPFLSAIVLGLAGMKMPNRWQVSSAHVLWACFLS